MWFTCRRPKTGSVAIHQTYDRTKCITAHIWSGDASLMNGTWYRENLSFVHVGYLIHCLAWVIFNFYLLCLLANILPTAWSYNIMHRTWSHYQTVLSKLKLPYICVHVRITPKLMQRSCIFSVVSFNVRDLLAYVEWRSCVSWQHIHRNYYIYQNRFYPKYNQFLWNIAMCRASQSELQDNIVPLSFNHRLSTHGNANLIKCHSMPIQEYSQSSRLAIQSLLTQAIYNYF